MFDVLYHDEGFLVVQSHAGRFDKQSDELYGEHNMGLHVGDDPTKVLNSRADFLRTLNALSNQKISRLHWVNQVHGRDVVRADLQGITPVNADALISDEKGVGLAIMTADCVPVVLFGGEQNEQKIACIHAGWQGLTKGIIKNAFETLGCPTNLKAVIAGCISQKNYEIDIILAHRIVDEVVAQDLVELDCTELFHEIIWRQPAQNGVNQNNDSHGESNQKCHIDIVKLTMLQLEKLGIKALLHSASEVPCSYAEPKLYSYRQQTHAKKNATGRMATVVVAL